MYIKQSASSFSKFSFSDIHSNEKNFMQDHAISAEVLMELAGFQAASWYASFFRETCAVVFCGKGNNGGDGLVMARHLYLMGVTVTVILMYPVTDFVGLPALELSRCRSLGIEINEFENQELSLLPEDSIFIDACVGIGLTGSLRPHLLHNIKQINRLSHICVALDVPSGMIDSCSFNVDDVFRVNYTLTFGYLKRVFFSSNPLVCGRVFLIYVGFTGNKCQGQSIIEIDSSDS